MLHNNYYVVLWHIATVCGICDLKKINLTQFVLLLNLLVATVPVSKQFAILHLEIYSINIIIIIMVHILYYSS